MPINATTWPTVVASTKLNAETDKLPNDYYPSLDELNTDRKTRQHNFVQQGTSHSLDKPPSPTTMSKNKTESSRKKTEAQEEAMSKVVKYVQDIEKMQQESSKQSSNNSSPVLSETTPTNPLPPKLPESTSYSSPVPETESSNGDNNSGKEFTVGSKNSGPRVRKSHIPTVQNPREFTPNSSQPQTDESKKVPSSQSDEPSKMIISNSSQLDEKDCKKITGSVHILTAGPSDTVDSSKTRMGNSVIKSVPQSRSIEVEAIRVHKPERILKNTKELQQIQSKDNVRVSYSLL